MMATDGYPVHGKQTYELFERDASLLDRVILDASRAFHLCDYTTALALLDPIIAYVEQPGRISPDGWPGSQQQRYAHFSEAFHADIYRRFYMPEGHGLHIVMDDFPGMYRLSGMCLRQTGRLSESKRSLECASAWGPMDMASRLELVTSLKWQHEFDAAFDMAREALAYSLLSEHFLSLYAELALLATERGELRLAMALSMVVMRANPANQEMEDVVAYLQQEQPEWQNQILSFQEIGELFANNGLITAPDARYCMLARDKADEAFKAQRFGEQAYYLGILMQLNPTEESAVALRQVSEQAIRQGQRMDGRDGFWLSGTFISTSTEVGLDGRVTRVRDESASRLFGTDDSGLGEGLAGHDHRFDNELHNDRQAPNALGGIPGIAYPGMPAPYDGHLARFHRRGNPSGNSPSQ
jgi:hypothetical protein